MTFARALATAFLGTSVLSAAAAQQPAAAPDLLKAASEYLAAYAPKISGVTLEEEYTFIDVSTGKMAVPQRLSSDLVLLNLNGKIIALRDAYAIDSNPLRAREPRITTLLAKPTMAAWEQVQKYASESFRHMHAELVAQLNEPMMALQFTSAENQPRVTWKIDGRKKFDGVETVGLRFQEPKNRDASYVIQTRGKAITSGRLWVDPATGRIHGTELSLQSSAETARISVNYKRYPALDVWLPSEMVDVYQTSESTGSISNMGGGSGYSLRQAFECRANYSNARLTPIDLRVEK